MADDKIKPEDVDCPEKVRCIRFPDDLASCMKCVRNNGKKDYFKPMDKPNLQQFVMGPPGMDGPPGLGPMGPSPWGPPGMGGPPGFDIGPPGMGSSYFRSRTGEER